MNLGNTYRALGILIAIVFSIFLVQPVFSVDVHEGVIFETKGTNTTFITGNNFTWDAVEVHSDHLLLGNQTISISPSVGSANVTIENFTITSILLNISANPLANITFLINNLAANKNYTVYNNSQFYMEDQTNGSGYFNFVFYNGGGQFFEINTTKRADGEPCVYDSECEGGYCVHGICRSSPTYCGDGYCDSGETCSSCPGDCGTCPPGDGDGGNGGYGGFVLPPATNETEEKCEPGEKRCSEGNLQECTVDGTIWTLIETCEYGCDPDLLECKTEPEPTGRICSPGEKRCYNGELQECSSDGSEWETKETCEYGCDPENLECRVGPEEVIHDVWIYGLLGLIAVIVVIVLVMLKNKGVILGKTKSPAPAPPGSQPSFLPFLPPSP